MQFIWNEAPVRGLESLARHLYVGPVDTVAEPHGPHERLVHGLDGQWQHRPLTPVSARPTPQRRCDHL